MIFAIRYPHVRDLVSFYAERFADEWVLSIMENGLHSEDDAEHLSHFIWKMLDEMARDREEGKIILGSVDNTSVVPDISYEMGVLMDESGFGSIWEKISDEY